MQLLDRLLSLDDSWLWWTADVGLKATLILAMAAAMTFLLRTASAALRHRVWALTFAALLLLPLASGLLPGWNWRIIPRDWLNTGEMNAALRSKGVVDSNVQNNESASAAADVAASASLNRASASTMSEQRASVQGEHPSLAPRSFNPEPTATEHAANLVSAPNADPPSSPPARRLDWLLVVWLAGALVALLPLATGVAGNLRLKLRGRRLVDADWQQLLEALSERLVLRRKVMLLAGGPTQMPMTFGWLRPYVVLPSDAARWSSDQRQAVLLHELAHVKRCDVPLQMIARTAFALYWLHPLAWWGLRRMRLEREHACDDCVLLAGQKASSYASQLLEIARAHRICSPLASAALSMARPSQLEGRLLAVLDADRSRAPLSAARGGLLLVSALLLVTCLGILRPTVQAESPKFAATEFASESKNTRAEKNGRVAQAEEQVIVTGTVVSSTGKPVAGALIEIVPLDRGISPGHRSVEEDIPYFSASGDSAGHFEVIVPREIFKRPFSNVSAFASADGYSTYQMGFGPDPHRQTVDFKQFLKLPDAKTVRLQLIDAAGNPLAGIEPTIWSLPTSMISEDLRAAKLLKSWPKCSRTGEDGYCRVVLPTAAKEAELLVEDERFGCQIVRIFPVDESISVVLKPGRFLNARVVAADTGAPIEGANVLFLEQPYRHLRTDRDGHFRLAGGSTIKRLSAPAIHIYPPADSPYLFHALEWKSPKDGIAESELTIKMEKGIVVEGQVVEKSSGEPVAGASVYFDPQEYNNKLFRESSQRHWYRSEMKYQTDDKGHFRLPVWPGPGYLFVEAPTQDYVHVMVSEGDKRYGKPGLEREYYDGALHLNLKPDENARPARVELQRGVTLHRKVVRPDGQPAEGAAYARSFLRDSDSWLMAFQKSALYFENGVLELPGFEPEHSNPLFVVDHEHHCAAAVSPAASEVDLASPPIQLQPTGSASFRFLSSNGEVLANYRPSLLLIVTPGARATHVVEPDQPLWSDSIDWDGTRYLPTAERPKTDADGRVVVSDLIPGATYRILFLGGHRFEDGYEFTVRSGETTDIGDVMFPPRD